MLFRNLGVFGKSKQTGFNPSKIGGLQLWLDATDESTITKDGSNFVSKWDDKSANAYSFTQGTAIWQPKYFASGFGTKSKAYLDFDGVNDWLRTTSTVIDLTKDATIFVVRQKIGTVDKTIFSTVSTGAGIMLRQLNTNQIRWYISGVVNDINTGVPYNDIMLHSFTLKKSTLSTDVRINGADIATRSYGAGTGHDGNLTIGALSNNGLPWDGKIVEMIYYSSKLTALQIEQVENYINNKYGIY